MIAIFLARLGFQICTCKQISRLNTCETCNIDSNYACTIYKMSEIAGGDK